MIFLPKEVSFQKVNQAGDEGVLMTRLVIAFNNFMVGDELWNFAKRVRDNPDTKEEGLGIGYYVLNTQIGYLHEAMYLLENSKDPTPTLASEARLKPYIDRLSPEGKANYAALTSMLEGGPERAQFEKYIERFRNIVAFHYDTGYRGPVSRGNTREDPIVKVALTRLATLDVNGPFYIGKYPHCRFGFADVVMDTAVCRTAWGIDPKFIDDELRREADEIITWIHDKIKAFVGFSSELCVLYFQEKTPPGSLLLPVPVEDAEPV